MSRRVYLHIGAPKTGTTYLQHRLSENRPTLAEHGVHYPRGPLGRDPGYSHFKAALDLLGQDWGGPPGHAEGYWDALVRKIRRSQGTVIVSHEVLAAAPADKIARAMADLDGSEVHIVCSARDVVRQLPAVWQENVKQGGRRSFKKFLDAVRRNPEAGFWRAQAFPDVLTRWGSGLEPERIHLVTVPQPGGAPETLWLRFCEAFGVEPAWAPRESDQANPSMGVAETTVVRRLNRRMSRTALTEHQYGVLIRRLLVHQNLALRDGRKATLPPRLHPWAAELSESWVEWAQASGIHVIGDLGELRPAAPLSEATWTDPDRPPRRELLDAALEALAVMTEEAARRPHPDEQLPSRVMKAARRLRGD